MKALKGRGADDHPALTGQLLMAELAGRLRPARQGVARFGAIESAQAEAPSVLRSDTPPARLPQPWRGPVRPNGRRPWSHLGRPRPGNADRLRGGELRHLSAG